MSVADKTVVLEDVIWVQVVKVLRMQGSIGANNVADKIEAQVGGDERSSDDD